MSRNLAARRERRAGRAPSVALFPFLAVLVCTMGSLIVVLVVLARQARIQAAQAADEKTSETQNDLSAAKELVEWRISELNAAVQKARADLAATRLKLGSIESHGRELRQQFSRLESIWKELDAARSQDGQQRRETEAQLAALRNQIIDAQRELAQAQAAAQNRPRSYAIIPYEGPNGTQRRPIYLECRAESIVLQPEGIELGPSDFPGALEPGNPLDRAVRAARESLLQQGRIKGDGTDEPYPLLLVRPEGIKAYYAARSAMRSWKGEVGYELIGDDWKLEFQKPDPELARSVRGAIAQARAEQRQKQAVLAMYSKSDKPEVVYRAAPGGGLIREEIREEKPKPGPRPRRAQVPVEERYNPGTSGGHASRKAPEDTIAAPRNPNAEQANAARSARPVRPGEWNEPERPPKPPEKDKKKEEKSETKSLAATRGENWGLPDAARGSVGVTREVRIHCQADKLVIVSDSGEIPLQMIPFSSRMDATIDAFVTAIWDHMKSWGIAGRAMYWRPILNVTVAPGADARFEEFQTLLDGSGLEVRRRG